MITRRSIVVGSMLACAVSSAAAADGEVQRQFQQREQQQMELRLKMQQQLDRAVPGQGQALGLQHRQIERDQQLRLQQLHDQQLRGTIAPVAPGAPESVQRDIERPRALQAGTEQLNRFGNDRRTVVDPGTNPSSLGP